MIKLLALMESLPGMDPGEKILHETLRQAFLLMQASEKKTAKQLANRRGIEGGEFEKLPFGRPDSIGNDGVAMRVEVGGECAKRLNGKDTSRPNVFTAKQRLEGFSDGLISGPGQESQEASLALEQAADDLGDGKGPMAIGDRREDLGDEFFGKQGGALGLTTPAEISCPA